MYKFNPVSTGGQTRDLDALIGRVSTEIEQGLLPVDVFCDDAVFRAEMVRIFGKTWVFVAHETEIPKAGDFVLRKIGIDTVIVTRDAAGSVNVMLNHCRHRGTEVCHEDQGNTKHFKCPYHGWTYNLKGEFAGAPHFNEAYGTTLDKKAWGLKRAAQVDSVNGFVFACLSNETAPLREYLGDTVKVLDAIFGLHPRGMRVVAPPERFTVKADWKSGAENFCGDAYHVSTAHVSAGLSDFIPDVRQVSVIARALDMGEANSFIAHEITQWGPMFEYWAYPKEVVDQFDFSNIDPVMQELIKTSPPTIGTIFPNFSFLRFPQPAVAGGRPYPFTSIRMWQPVAPGVMELWNWQFEYDCVDEETTQMGYLAGVYGFGSGGIFEQDDTAVWEGIAKAANSPWNRRDGVQLHYQQQRVEPSADWKGPGEFYDNIYGERLQAGFWKRWVKEMQTTGGQADSATQNAAQGEQK
jgi:phenylpropionate dioxygenase-like ring-hydroxylating dioxygenase large terminal subunit